MPYGLDLAVQQMKEGEEALVTILDGATYGPAAAVTASGSGSDQQQVGEGEWVSPSGVTVSSSRRVEYWVELVSMQKRKEKWEMNPDEKVSD